MIDGSASTEEALQYETRPDGSFVEALGGESIMNMITDSAPQDDPALFAQEEDVGTEPELIF